MDSLCISIGSRARTTAGNSGFTVAEVDTKSCVLGDVICVQRSRPDAKTLQSCTSSRTRFCAMRAWKTTSTTPNLLASALLLPRRDFKRSLRNLGWDFRALKSEYPAASLRQSAGVFARSLTPHCGLVTCHKVLCTEWQAGRRRKRPPEVTEALDWLCTTSEPWHSPSAVRVEVEGWIRAIAIH